MAQAERMTQASLESGELGNWDLSGKVFFDVEESTELGEHLDQEDQGQEDGEQLLQDHPGKGMGGGSYSDSDDSKVLEDVVQVENNLLEYHKQLGYVEKTSWG